MDRRRLRLVPSVDRAKEREAELRERQDLLLFVDWKEFEHTGLRPLWRVLVETLILR
jgi:hypothetical protein